MKADTVEAIAHGRVNLIGEHTDYNGGWVFPTAIPQFTRVTLTPRDDQTVIANAGKDPKTGAPRRESYELGKETLTKSWIDYIQGVTCVLRQADQELQGFEVTIESTVPEASGLSSSAALEIALLKALRDAFRLRLEDLELAKLGQRAENEFIGARIGIMDQVACSIAHQGEALFLDTRDLSYRRVKIPTDELDLMIISSGVSHNLSATGEGYNKRRAQCEEACQLLGVRQLRDLSPEDLPKLDRLPEVLKRRARHVITENERVHGAVRALEKKDYRRLGELFYESHASMRDDYEVSCEEVDLLVELCRKEGGVLGARLTGGGFGGSIVAVTRHGESARIASNVLKAYQERIGGRGAILVP